MTVRLSRVRDGLKARNPANLPRANLGAPASPDPARIRAPNRWPQGYFAKAHATWHIARETSLGRDTRARPRALGSEGVSSSRERSLPRLCRARAERASSHRLAPPHGPAMFFSASPARTPLASSRAIRSRVGVDRASRVRGRPPSRALVTRARVEPRVLEDDSHARRRANAVSVASPPTPCARSVVARSPAVPSTAPSTTTATSSLLAR